MSEGRNKNHNMSFCIFYLLTPIQKTYNEQSQNFNWLGKCKTKIKHYDVLQFFLLVTFVHLSRK